MYASINDDMKTVIEKLNGSLEKKLVVKNENNTIAGIICLSDIFKTITN